jgi:hypothetical protein
MDYSASRQGLLEGYFENGNEPSPSVKWWEILE